MKLYRQICATLLLSIAFCAHALTTQEQTFTCPIGGEHFTALKAMSGTVAGSYLDLQKYGPIASPWPLQKCPLNGFVMFSREIDEKGLRALEAYIGTEPYKSKAKSESNYYLAYMLMRELGYPPGRLAYTLLHASWEADTIWKYRAYAQEALLLYEAESERLKNESTTEAFATMHVRGELLRRLMRFSEARDVFERQLRRPGLQGTGFETMAQQELDAIRWFKFWQIKYEE